MTEINAHANVDHTELTVDIGSKTDKGVKPVNEDDVHFLVPDLSYVLEQKGVCCALADGVSTAEAGREASLIAVSQFVEDYYLAPETWSAAHTGEKILSAINLSLFKKSHQFQQEEKGFLCTFVGLVLKSQTAHFFHIGDSRIYRLRPSASNAANPDNVGKVGNVECTEQPAEFKQLTRDHNAFIGNGKSYLTRALGMDNNVHIDYGKIDLLPGDQFMMTSDGLHDFVDDTSIVEVLSNQNLSSQQKTDQLMAIAKANNSDDNISCLVVDVKQISNQSLDDLNAKLTRLPFPPFLDPGMKVDGLIIKKEIFASPRSQLYIANEASTGQEVVMKTPSRNYLEDTAYIDRFIQEEWIGKRINSDKVVKIIEQTGPRSCLYYLMENVQGIGLDDWIAKNPHPKPKVAIDIVKQIAEGLKAFHDNDTIHQDLRPANILINDKGPNDIQIKIVDFGSTFVAGTAELFNPIDHEGALGTASYSDPQYLLGKNPGIQGDLYSLATITYELFTGHLPYGDKVEDCQTAFDYDHLRYRSASYHNPIIPLWFDRALEKGVQLDTEKRYETMAQFLHDLTTPNPDFLLDVPESAKKHNSVLFWVILSGTMMLLLIIVISMFNS
jgi:serine/threonine protein phosphatase PrpC